MPFQVIHNTIGRHSVAFACIRLDDCRESIEILDEPSGQCLLSALPLCRAKLRSFLSGRGRETFTLESGLLDGICMQISSKAPEMTDPQSTLEDEELMLRVGRGEEKSLALLIERWQTPMLNFFYRSTQDYGRAEDLTQTVFIRLFRAAERYQPTAKFSTYIFHIARRLLINDYEKSKRRPADATDPHGLHAVDAGDTERKLNELEEIFQNGLKDLPENQRTAILLLKQQELSYAEIAAVMSSSESAVKTWIFRARQHLKQVLNSTV
jgi:RNA polymerase sigma-70 factor (ECF subfamily)